MWAGLAKIVNLSTLSGSTAFILTAFLLKLNPLQKISGLERPDIFNFRYASAYSFI